MIKPWAIVLSGLCLSACASLPKTNAVQPGAPDYTQLEYWAAHPNKDDPADRCPPGLKENQANAVADVFFLHPTTYWGEKKRKSWNAPVDDNWLNRKTDSSTILFQASIFNEAGRVFAPRYRQAHLHAYFAKAKEKEAAEAAFALAYSDVKNAFTYYLEHHNQGRPIIIAAHSQGTTHAKQLLRDFFDHTPRINQLVVAYLVGIPVVKGYFDHIPPCESPEETGCFTSWRSFRKGYVPAYHREGHRIAVTNPLRWSTDTLYAPKTLNEGVLLRDFNKLYPQLADAQIHDGLLWVTKPRFPGSIFLTRANYHIADYNFYYLSVRKNASTRLATWLKKR